jgi:hypothetical protein
MTLDGWVPVSASESDVHWRLLPGHCFTDPFFEDTVRRHHGAPARLTSWEEAERWIGECPGLQPAGLVYHMSRCGSTLVAQMLAAVAENRVMAEPPVLDDVLRQGSGSRLRTIVHALGQAAQGETRFFLKVDCWHIGHYETMRAAFPKTPAVFLYRHPLEVLVSQMRNPGEWTAAIGANREQGIADLLGEMMAAALRHTDTLHMVNYTDLPDAVFDLFGLRWTAEQTERMRSASHRDAKSPKLPFSGDSAAKRKASTDRARAAAQTIEYLYDELRARSVK